VSAGGAARRSVVTNRVPTVAKRGRRQALDEFCPHMVHFSSSPVMRGRPRARRILGYVAAAAGAALGRLTPD
jgi:hypothetical protein